MEACSVGSVLPTMRIESTTPFHRFLVIRESSLLELSRYISSITGVSNTDNLLSVFPQLAMVVAKHRYEPVKHKDESVTIHMSITLYKSIASSTLFIAPVTGSKLRQTTFFNASVQGWTDHGADHPTFDEQVASLILRKGTFLKRVDGPALLERHDWRGEHSADPDFQLSLQVESAPRSLSSGERYQADGTDLADTLQEVFRLIPRRRRGNTDMYHIRIDCDQDGLMLLMRMVSLLWTSGSGVRLIEYPLATDLALRQHQTRHSRRH